MSVVQVGSPLARASVVIPAYNEGRVISRCLDALRAASVPVEVVVAANGCTDDTVARATAYDDVTVLDIATGSKSLALNSGDEAARAFPRLFLDADIVLDDEALGALVEALDVDAAVVAAPKVRFHTRDSSVGVRAYYDVFTKLPYAQEGLVGLGVYGLSRAGRARFESFPSLQADDLFVQRLFAPAERLTTAGHFTVYTPRDLGNLLKVRTRIARGNAEMATATSDEVGAEGDFATSTSATLKALGRLVVAQPRLAPGAAVYVGTTVLARLRAKRAASATWQRDTSTR